MLEHRWDETTFLRWASPEPDARFWVSVSFQTSSWKRKLFSSDSDYLSISSGLSIGDESTFRPIRIATETAPDANNFDSSWNRNIFLIFSSAAVRKITQISNRKTKTKTKTKTEQSKLKNVLHVAGIGRGDSSFREYTRGNICVDFLLGRKPRIKRLLSPTLCCIDLGPRIRGKCPLCFTLPLGKRSEGRKSKENGHRVLKMTHDRQRSKPLISFLPPV